MSALREIFALFDVSVNTEALDAASGKLDSMVGKLKAVGQALAGFAVVKTIASFGQHVAEAARAVEFHAGRMEMDTDSYQKLSQVAQEYGMTVENLQIANTLFVRSLSGVGGTMGEFHARTSQASQAFKNLGLNAKQFKGQQLEEILPTIADAMTKIHDPLERVAIGLNLFGHRGRSIMPMLAQGGDKLRAAFAAARPVFEKLTIESANEATVAGLHMDRAWDHLINNTFGKALLDAFAKVAPVFTKIILFVEELSKRSEIGKASLISLGVALAAAAAMIIATWWPVLLPIAAVLAAFVALALVVDDFIVFMQGGQSVIGRFFNELLGEGGAEKAREKINEMWDDFKGFLADLKAQAFQDFLKGVKETVSDIRNAIHDIKAAIAWIEEHWAKLKNVFDTVGHELGGGSSAGSASDPKPLPPGAGVHDVPSIPGAVPLNVTQVQPDGTPVGTNSVLAPGTQTYQLVFPNNIDSKELAGKVKQVVEVHNNDKLDQVLRETLSGVGGAK